MVLSPQKTESFLRSYFQAIEVCQGCSSGLRAVPLGDDALGAFLLFVIVTLPTYGSAILSFWMLHHL